MLSPGTILQSRYRVLRVIGGGGMGMVYLVEDTRLPGRNCAVKEMSPAQLPTQDRNWAIEAFKQEASILAGLQHPGIAAVNDFFAERGNWYLVMEYISGQTLDQVLAISLNQRLPAPQALEIFDQLCKVLESLHARQPPVIFRDLKPGNVMLTPQGDAKLIDFGIARFFKPAQGRDTVALGTPGYAAPEQYGRGQTDARADVYGLGVLLHQMLTGHDPATTPFNLPPAESLNSNVPLKVGQAICHATAHNPQQRFHSIDHFRAAVMGQTGVLPPTPVSSAAPRWLIGMFGAGALIMLVACGVGAYLLKPKPTPTMVARTTPTPIAIDTPSPPTPKETVTLTLGSGRTPSEEPAEVTRIVTTTPTPPTPTATLTPPVDQALIPAGTFIRGSTSDDIQAVLDQLCSLYTDTWCRENAFTDELIVSGSRETHLNDFYIDRYEVTNAQYDLCVEAGACAAPGTEGSNPRHAYVTDSRYSDYPVIYVTWYDAQNYCAWMGGRLPSAAEWEKAARGTDGRWWPWGNKIPTTEANFRHPDGTAAEEEDITRKDGEGDPARVGSFLDDSSPFGVLDMAGNVMEWVDSWYDSDTREIRGGSWNTGSFAMRAAGRTRAKPGLSYFDIGFRCAYDAKP